LKPFTISPTATSSLFAGSGTYFRADLFGVEIVDREDDMRGWLDLQVVEAESMRLVEVMDDVADRSRLRLLIEVDLASIRSSLSEVGAAC
jgi:hypothetical protein